VPADRVGIVVAGRGRLQMIDSQLCTSRFGGALLSYGFLQGDLQRPRAADLIQRTQSAERGLLCLCRIPNRSGPCLDADFGRAAIEFAL